MAHDELPELSAGEWRALATDVSERFVAALDPGSARLPRGVAGFVRLPAGFTLARSASAVPEMSLAVRTLAVYGHTERAGRAVAEFRALPFATHRFPEPSSFQIAVHVVWFFARRAGDAATVALLDPLLDLIPRERLRPAYLDGTVLDDPLDKPDHVRAAYPPRKQASSALMQLGMLSSMWVYGGSDAFPRSRIEAEVERYLAALFAVPGCAPIESAA